MYRKDYCTLTALTASALAKQSFTFLCDGQDTVRLAILYGDRSCFILLACSLGVTLKGKNFFLWVESFWNGFVVQGPVVQNIVSLTSSLRGQLVKCFMALYPNTLIFLLKK